MNEPVMANGTFNNNNKYTAKMNSMQRLLYKLLYFDNINT